MGENNYKAKLDNIKAGEYIAVDVYPTSSTFKAVKKYLGPDGPFHLQSSRYTVLERRNIGSGRAESLGKMQTQLVLGHGLHTISFKGFEIVVHYDSSSPPEAALVEHMTIYCNTTGTPTEVAITTTEVAPANPTSEVVGESSDAPPGQDQNAVDEEAPTTQQQVPRIKEEQPSSAQEAVSLFLTSASEYQYKTENDFIVVLSLKEDTLTWDNEIIRPKRPLASVVFSSGVKEQILEDLDAFRADKQFYRQHGIPYKRGYLLHGPPGCGKTSLISALASQYDLTICPIPLSNPKITDNVLVSLMTSAPPESIIVLEDIDIVFTTHGIHARNVAASSTGITFSGLTNALDGVTSTEDKIIIMTTNFRDKLNLDAMMRPGRVDRIFEITYADTDALYELFLHFFPGKKKQANLFKNYVVGRNIPTAYIQSFFLKYKRDARSAWENCQLFLDDYEKNQKDTEDRRKKYDDEERKKEGAGGFLGLF